MLRLILAALLAIGAIPTAATAADPLPYGPSLSFAAYRNGQPIGHHTLLFQKNGSQVTVLTSVDFAVKVLGFTAYRYTHQAQEVWEGGTFVSLSSWTDDNGRIYKVDVTRDPSGLKVERFDRRQVVKASAAFEGFQQPAVVREIVPGHILPSTQWNVRQTRQPILLNTQYGTESQVRIAPIAHETIRTASGAVPAIRYRYSGDLSMDQWFDDNGRWVKASFVAHDGSTIEYILQE